MEDEVELFEEAEITPGELDDDDLIEELEDEAFEEEELLADEAFGTDDEDDGEVLGLVEDEEEGEILVPPAAPRVEEGEEDEAVDLDEVDLEPSLDDILRERVGVDEDELAAEEEEEEGRPEPVRGEEAESLVLPQQSWEFVCSACFLVKNRTQLVDTVRLLCRDCAE